MGCYIILLMVASQRRHVQQQGRHRWHQSTSLLSEESRRAHSGRRTKRVRENQKCWLAACSNFHLRDFWKSITPRWENSGVFFVFKSLKEPAWWTMGDYHHQSIIWEGHKGGRNVCDVCAIKADKSMTSSPSSLALISRSTPTKFLSATTNSLLNRIKNRFFHIFFWLTKMNNSKHTHTLTRALHRARQTARSLF